MQSVAGGCSRPLIACMSTGKARSELGWAPRYDFRHALERVKAGEGPLQPADKDCGCKGFTTPALLDRTRRDSSAPPKKAAFRDRYRRNGETGPEESALSTGTR